MSKTHYIVYASKIKFSALLKPSAMAKLVEVTRLRNEKEGVTGFLCFGNMSFLQYLEGNRATIEQMFEQIKHDKHYYDLLILEEGIRQQRRFPEWRVFATRFEAFVTNYPPAHAFIPFEPYHWSHDQVRQFIDMFQAYYLSYDPEQAIANHSLHYNGVSASISAVFGYYQFSMFYKVMLLILVLITGLVLYNFSHFTSFWRLQIFDIFHQTF